MTITPPPNPTDLDARHAAALADEVESVFDYLARLARSAADLIDELADEAVRLADGAGDDDRPGLEADAADVLDASDLARTYAFRAAESLARLREDKSILDYAAEDTEPAAVAEVALHLADSVSTALQAIADDTPPI